MDQIWKFIVDNKSWLFEGAGVAIVLGIVGYFFKKRNISKMTQKSGSHSKNIQAGGDIRIGKDD